MEIDIPDYFKVSFVIRFMLLCFINCIVVIIIIIIVIIIIVIIIIIMHAAQISVPFTDLTGQY